VRAREREKERTGGRRGDGKKSLPLFPHVRMNIQHRSSFPFLGKNFFPSLFPFTFFSQLHFPLPLRNKLNTYMRESKSEIERKGGKVDRFCIFFPTRYSSF